MKDFTNSPWGTHCKLHEASGHTVKLLTINPGHRFSLQYHDGRDETMMVVAGRGVIDISIAEWPSPMQRHTVKCGSFVKIPVGHAHRARCAEDSDSPLVIVEAWVGEDLREDDIIRLADDYGRNNG